ncbi:MAG: hypothetical protein WA323_18885 [Candidatus Nitrosopolaris sp.]|jgi:hypothetical protein
MQLKNYKSILLQFKRGVSVSSEDELEKITKHEEGTGKKCPKCGSFNKLAFKYCGSCGMKYESS